MKTIILGMILMTSFSAYAENSCDQMSITKTMTADLYARVGKPVAGSGWVLKVENVAVLVSEDNAGDLKALFSYEETISRSSTSEKSNVYKMLGYAKFEKTTCNKVDGIIMGSTPAVLD